MIPMDEMPSHEEFMDDVRELFSRPEYAQFLEPDGVTLKKFRVTIQTQYGGGSSGADHLISIGLILGWRLDWVHALALHETIRAPGADGRQCGHRGQG
jgi:hypothetical protein